MTYSLELHFEPPLQEDRLLRYFAGRRYFGPTDYGVRYDNGNTGVEFFVTFRTARRFLQRRIVGVEFEVNYHRPSYFGMESEIELSALITAFNPRIEDLQIRGMGEGPYSREGFFNGWNFGNFFSVRNSLMRDPNMPLMSMPAEKLRGIWHWNYHAAEQRWWNRNRYFVPTIRFHLFEGRLTRIAVWPKGEAVLLPRVDYVLIGKIVSDKICYGLASWPEVIDVVQRAGCDTTPDPLDLDYIITPPVIADWVSKIDVIDTHTLESFDKYKMVDEEIIAAARGA